jgi:hypothetical protein
MQKRPLPDAWRRRFADFAVTESEFPAGR